MAHFGIEHEDDDKVVLRDIGPWDRNRTITNDAEHVVEYVAHRLRGRRLFYYDSEGEYGELVVADGKFAGFAPASPT
jgi:hypothetical protein